MQRRKPNTAHHQERRRRALDRFQVDEARAKKDPDYAERKAIELASLQRSVAGSS